MVVSLPLSTFQIHDMNDAIRVRGARVHNLKNVDVDIPKGKFTVITGLSGSGKSSLAFDTIYAEGQRRYMESLSSYARQFLEMQDKPDVDEISGLSPTIAIDQKTASTNPRSTVGTVTEIYDALRVLFARAGVVHCPECKIPVAEMSLDSMARKAAELAKTSAIYILAPMVSGAKGDHLHIFDAAKDAGYTQARLDGLLIDIEDAEGMKIDRKRAHDVDIVVGEFAGGKAPEKRGLLERLSRALDLGNGQIVIMSEETGDDTAMSQSLSCSQCGWSCSRLEPANFSFNSPRGACPACTGLGIRLVLEEELVIPNRRLTLAEGAVKPWSRIAGNSTSHLRILEIVGARHKFDIHTPLSKLSESKVQLILRGTGGETYEDGETTIVFNGILGLLEEKYRETASDYVRKELEQYMRTVICPECDGKRLCPESLAVKVAGSSIADFVSFPLDEFALEIGKLTKSATIKESGGLLSEAAKMVLLRVCKEVAGRLENVIRVGLGYLTLDRSAVSLSGGESQRLRLATQLGTNLSGVIYILDEPSIGLHPRDNWQLIETIKSLRDMGNTVIVVEHDEAMIRAADYIVDVGPGAGIYGGEIVGLGKAASLSKFEESLTGQYLAKKKTIPTPKKRRRPKKEKITIEDASAFNLKNLTVNFPLGVLTCVTGVSGSGKSTLVLDILGKALAKYFFRAKEFPGEHKGIYGLDAIDKVVTADQSPIGRTPRSNPATYTGVFTAIRDVFAETPEAKMRGYDAGKFSFNVKGGGRCEPCGGDGMNRIEMQFMPDVYVECRECRGQRYNAEALEIHWRGKTIADVLNMTIEEARRFFAEIPAIHDKLNVLFEVGLGYMRLGQSATTLSGGEAQRVKLATELSRRATGRTLYILDEPTTGLHFEDVKRLLEVLNRLVNKGNTVIMVEHDLDMIRAADWIVDMGPEGGVGGGEIVAEGTPEEVAKESRSLTGKYLAKAL